ncbi:MAG: TolC family protein [Bacteroidota bacterium]
MRFLPTSGMLVLLCTFVAFSQTAPTISRQAEKLSLQEAITLALQNNPDILRAQKEIDAAGGRILQAGRIPNPDLSVVFNEAPTGLQLGRAGERDVTLSQTIEFPGKRALRMDAAESGRTVSEMSLVRTKVIVTARTKQAYYKALLAGEVVRSLEFTIGLFADFQKVVTDRYQTQASSYLDVIRTRVELTRLRNDLFEAQRDETLRLAELNILLGRPSEVTMALSDSLKYEPLLLSEDEAVSSYAAQSYSLRISEQRVRQSQSLQQLARRSYFPDLAMSAALQRRPNQANPATTTTYFGLGLGLSIPLWFWQGPRGEIQETQAVAEATAINLDATARQVRQNIAAAFRTAHVAEQQLIVFDTSLLADVEDELRSGIAAYQNNQIDALNVFDIYRTYRATKLEHSRALFNYTFALADLEAAKEILE